MDKLNQKNLDDVQIIRKADLENHNKDGGLWVVIHGKVYDVHEFKTQVRLLISYFNIVSLSDTQNNWASTSVFIFSVICFQLLEWCIFKHFRKQVEQRTCGYILTIGVVQGPFLHNSLRNVLS